MTGSITDQLPGSLIFRKGPSQSLNRTCPFICVSFGHISKLKIIGDMSSDLCDDVLHTLGARVSSCEITPGRLKVKFCSNTWLVTGEDSGRTQLLVICLLECLDKHGFQVFTAVETQNGHSGYETDSLICYKP